MSATAKESTTVVSARVRVSKANALDARCQALGLKRQVLVERGINLVLAEPVDEQRPPKPEQGPIPGLARPRTAPAAEFGLD